MKSLTPKRIVVCADDFGLTFGASQSIIALAERAAISAASCVVDGPYAACHAPALLSSLQNCSIGLHLNLTENPHLHLNAGIRTWLLRSFVLRSIERHELEREIARQLDVFETLFGRGPAFVDGHEHVHQFPCVRDALLNVLCARYGREIAIRITVPTANRSMKAALIAALGGRSMQAKLKAEGFTANSDFAGVYDLVTQDTFERRISGWLRSLADGGLIMCHPEVPATSAQPESARNAEHRYLSSPAWSSLRKQMEVQLVRFDYDTMKNATNVDRHGNALASASTAQTSYT
jgi:predicted glycoside hydrolase/deacetylase ChbG (UPF0249 family)